MGHEVKVGQRDAALVVSKRFPVTLAEIGGVLGGAFGEIYDHIEATGAESKGPPFVIYHGSPESGEPFDVEVCAPVVRAIDPPEGWQTQVLPAGTFATLLHVGSYEGLGAAYASLTEWVGGHDLAIAGPPREVYLSEPGTPPDQVRTIIEFPITEVLTPVATS